MNLACVPVAWVGRLASQSPPGTGRRYGVRRTASLLYTRGNLGLDTDTADMISADPQWRQTWIELKEAFRTWSIRC